MTKTGHWGIRIHADPLKYGVVTGTVGVSGGRYTYQLNATNQLACQWGTANSASNEPLVCRKWFFGVVTADKLGDWSGLDGNNYNIRYTFHFGTASSPSLFTIDRIYKTTGFQYRIIGTGGVTVNVTGSTIYSFATERALRIEIETQGTSGRVRLYVGDAVEIDTIWTGLTLSQVEDANPFTVGVNSISAAAPPPTTAVAVPRTDSAGRVIERLVISYAFRGSIGQASPCRGVRRSMPRCSKFGKEIVHSRI